ncbi:MAG: hypothetical protein ACRDZY_21880, partial [Acidimicrobiales bacterium]
MPAWDDDHGRTRSAAAVAPESDRAAEGLDRNQAHDHNRAHDHDLASARRGVATFGGEYRPGGLKRGVRAFVHRYGWRAYALPVLIVVTAAALLTAHSTVASEHHHDRTTTQSSP